MTYERLPELPPRAISTAAPSLQGIAFTRYATALSLGRGSLHRSLTIAQERWPRSPAIAEALRKSAVDPGTTSDTDWAAPLASYRTLADEFIDALRPASILGRIQGLTSAPTMTMIPRVVSGTSGAWVGEGKPIPVGKLALDGSLQLGPTKIAQIVVLSIELLQDSRPSAESLVRRDLLAAVAAYGDQQFIDPTVTATANNPASITNGAPTIASTGSSVAQITTDVKAMFASALSAGHSFETGAWVMHPRTALYLGSVLTTGNVPMWPTVSIKGGTFFGLPVVTSTSVPIDTGDDSYIILLDAADIVVADGATTIDIARDASLQMRTDPLSVAAQQVSLWQNNLAALKVTRYLSYARRRDSAVVVLSGVSY